MSDDLVEKVIDAMSDCGSETVGSRMARAAIAVALEEAAKVAEGMWWQGRSNLTTAPYAAAKEVGDEIAAAIRALEEEPT